jgi:hypothetical protein
MRKISSARAVILAFLGGPLLASPALAFDACLGAKVTACLDAIRPRLGPMAYQLAQRSIEKYLAGDIAGMRKAKGVVSVAYNSPFAEQFEPPQLIEFDYAPSLEISQIMLTLRKGSGTAESEDEYQDTHMYEAVLFALGTQDNCREMATPHDFYLFFHTKVRPRLKTLKLERVEGAFNPPSSLYAETGWIGICGQKMNYKMSAAEWGAVGDDMTRKYGAYRVSLVFR